ncbi:MAG: glycosyltransferase [Bacteroides sp.]|nr:glycosyltransferase [Bacteroides sp.]MCM1379971.1 glycosyltransferase [Bacteroides sp.]MCM1446274.1 glycosyltransferase [Prevotella sp.]
MKIAILSTSLTVGGAAIVTDHLAEALLERGHNVRTFTVGNHRERQLSFLTERLEVFVRNGFRKDTLFKISTGDFGKPGIVSQVKKFQPDAIILGWINQGFLSLKQITELSEIAQTAWVMHDMWNLTGICHHSMGCQRFCGQCGNCPMIAGWLRRNDDLSHKVWQKKREFYSRTPLKLIAVSEWVKEMARRSSLLRDYNVDVIHNVYPLNNYRISEKDPGLIAFGAERLDNPIKGLDHAIDALNMLPDGLNAHVKFFGNIKDSSLLKRLKIPCELTGSLKPDEVAELLSHAQVVLNTSHYETFGNTLLEGQASGAVPVSFNRGGQVDIIDHKRSGYLAEFGDVAAITRGIEWALSGALSPDALRAAAEARFSASAVATRFEQLFSDR